MAGVDYPPRLILGVGSYKIAMEDENRESNKLTPTIQELKNRLQQAKDLRDQLVKLEDEGADVLVDSYEDSHEFTVTILHEEVTDTFVETMEEHTHKDELEFRPGDGYYRLKIRGNYIR